MEGKNVGKSLWGMVMALAIVLLLPANAVAHCDGMDGPVVKAAQKALETGNVNLVLIWVRAEDEQQIKRVFDHTLAVRKLGPQARELADRYFFETVVRIHREGEGEPYTGLKPAGRDLGPAIPAADKALESGSVEALVKLLTEDVQAGIRSRFQPAVQSKQFNAADVAAGRAHVQAYVEFLHYVERIHQAAAGSAHGAEHQTARSGH